MTQYREPAGLGVCTTCRQSWDGWGLICNDCRQIAALNSIASQNSNGYGTSNGPVGVASDTSYIHLMWITVIAFFCFNYFTNWIFLKVIWMMLKVGIWIFGGFLFIDSPL